MANGKSGSAPQSPALFARLIILRFGRDALDRVTGPVNRQRSSSTPSSRFSRESSLIEPVSKFSCTSRNVKFRGRNRGKVPLKKLPSTIKDSSARADDQSLGINPLMKLSSRFNVRRRGSVAGSCGMAPWSWFPDTSMDSSSTRFPTLAGRARRSVFKPSIFLCKFNSLSLTRLPISAGTLPES